MTRERLGTQELDGVLGVLDTAQQQASSAPADGPPQLPPRRSNGVASGPVPAIAPAQAATASAKLFEPVRVDGEEQLGRAVGEEKVAILRKKVRALEDRVQAIRDAWNSRDGEIDAARQDGAREKQRAEQAEENGRKLTEILQSMKQEVGAYHTRVQEAMQEAARREQELRKDSERRIQEAQQSAEQKVRDAQQDAARRVVAMGQDAEKREQQALSEHTRREREALQLHSKREQETAREHDEAMLELQRREQNAQAELQRREQNAQAGMQRREQELQHQYQRREQALRERSDQVEEALKARAVAAEQALRAANDARDREKALPPAPPPPPVITRADVEELAQSVDAIGRTISGIIKGRVRESDQTEALRQALGQLRANHELLSSVLRDME